jgi:uncharacterized protein (TIGR02246 family)
MQTGEAREKDDEQAIRDLVDRWLAASRDGDIETVLGLMSDDVVFMVPGKEPFGKKEFAAANASMKDLDIKGTSDIQELKVLGDWAWMRNHLKVTMKDPKGNQNVRAGYTLTILRKDNGKWVIARDANLLTPEKA